MSESVVTESSNTVYLRKSVIERHYERASQLLTSIIGSLLCMGDLNSDKARYEVDL